MGLTDVAEKADGEGEKALAMVCNVSSNIRKAEGSVDVRNLKM